MKGEPSLWTFMSSTSVWCGEVTVMSPKDLTDLQEFLGIKEALFTFASSDFLSFLWDTDAPCCLLCDLRLQ